MNAEYVVVIEKSDTGFGAYVPDLPGCVAVGETKDETLSLIREAIEFHLEGMREAGETVPPPTLCRNRHTGVMSDGLIADRMNLNRPRGIAFDRAGNLIFTETFSAHRIRRIDGPTGVVTTIAGGVAPGFSGDGGPALQAQFRDPTEITVDRAGNLYVLDFANARIRRIDTAGIVTTIAGSGTQGFSGDGGPALDATFNVGVYDNGGLAVDSRGNLYLADTYNARVRKIDTTTGIITTFVADTGTVYGVAVDSADNVYVAFNNLAGQPRIRRFSPTGQLGRSWGMGFGFSEDDTPAEGAALGLVWRILVDPNGNILFAGQYDSSPPRSRRTATTILQTKFCSRIRYSPWANRFRSTIASTLTA